MLAFACAFTMFAGAAFTDQADIETADAVDTLVALGVIDGYEDGSFQPDVTVNRAEMAKMIYTILNGGNDDASAYENLPTSFTDLGQEGWATGYIKYLQNTGIIAGKTVTQFAPSDTVTGVEAAKMMLVAAGYSADKAGLEGSAWIANTMRYANMNNLFDGVVCDVNSGLPRQYAAQIMYNSLEMENVVYSNDIEGFKPATDVDDDRTIGGKYMDLTTYEGVLYASGEYAIDKSAGKDKFTFTAVKKDGKAITDDDLTFDYEEDLTALLGQYVKVQVGKNDKVYGVFAMDSENTVVTAAFKDVKIDGTKIKVDGTSYNYNDVAITGVAKDNSSTALKISELTGNYAEVASGDQITFISNDGDSKFDLAIVNPMKAETGSLDKVTYVSDSEFVAGGKTYDFDEVIAPSDLAKGDYVARFENTFTGDQEFVKADVVTGKVTSTKDSGKEVKIGDEWFKVGNTTADRPFYGALTRKGDAVELNSTVTAQVINGVIYNADAKSTSSTDTALVLAAPGSMDMDGNYQVKLLFADGSTKVVSADAKYDKLDGALVTWEISDDLYELTEVSALNLADGDSYATSSTGFVKSSKTLAGKKVAGDAVIYVNYVDGTKDKQDVLTGDELNALGGDFNGNVKYVVKDGLISLAYINSSSYLPGSNADQLYGYIVSDVTENNDNNVKYKQYNVYTTDGQLVKGVMQKATTAVAKGDFVKLSLTADNYAEGVTVLNVDSKAGALMNYGDDYIVVLGSDSTAKNVDLDDDVKYLVVNTKDTKGIGNEADLEKASETGTANEYFANVSYYKEGSNAVLVVIDTTGKWYAKGASNETKVSQNVAGDPSTMEVKTATTSANSLTVSSGTITDKAPIALTGYNATAGSEKNKFDIALTSAANTTATMTLEGSILKNGAVTLTSDNAAVKTQGDVEVTGTGTITGKIVVTANGLASKTINFTITVA